MKAALLGQGISELASKLAERGASEVLHAEGEAVRHYTADGYRRVLASLIDAESPDLVLLGHTPNGWDLAPLLAARLGTPVATGCSRIVLEGGKGRFTRKAFNGKFVHEVEIEGRTLFATVEKGASAPPEGVAAGTVKTIPAANGEARYKMEEIDNLLERSALNFRPQKELLAAIPPKRQEEALQIYLW